MPASPTTFRRLLKAESTAAMPTTEREVDALFDTYHVRPDHDARKVRGTNSKPSSERLELAAAVLWFHTHVNDPVPALTRLPFEMQELLSKCFVPDFAFFKGESPNWPSKLACFLKFAAPSDSTPQRRAPPARRGANARQAGAPSTGGSSGPAAGPVDKGVPHSAVPTLDHDSDVEQGGGGGSVLSDDPDLSGSGAFAGSSGSAGKKHKRGPKKKKKKSKHSKKHKRSRRSSSSSSSSSSSASEDEDSAAGRSDQDAWSLPSRLSGTAAERAQVEAACGRRPEWVSIQTLILGLSSSDWLGRLFKGQSKGQKHWREYERHLQPGYLSEDRNDPFWLHRLSFVYSRDEGYELDAKNLALLAVGESPSDYAGVGGFKDQDGLKKYKDAVAELKIQWELILMARRAGADPGQPVYGNFKAQLLVLFARRYALMYSHLSPRALSQPLSHSRPKRARRASREVLGHTARQVHEIQIYLDKFFDDVYSRAAAVCQPWEIGRRADFVGSRVERVFGGAVQTFIDVEGATAPAPGGGSLGSGGAAAGAGAFWPAGAAAGPASSWGPPPPYSAPGSAPLPPPGHTTPAAAPGGYFSQIGQPAAPPDGSQAHGQVPSGGPQRATVKRGLSAAMDGAQSSAGGGQGGAGGGGPGGSDGRSDGLDPHASRVRFSPVVKVEHPRDGGEQQGPGGFLGLPAHPWLLGKYAPYTGRGALSSPCQCSKKFDAALQGVIGKHARWDCPLRYIERFGSCPGFADSGLRLRSAWIDDDTMTADTVGQWKRFIDATGLQRARNAPSGPLFP